MEKQQKCLSTLLIVAILVLIANANPNKRKTITTICREENDSDQCKDVIQDNPEFGYCLKAISQKWPTELAVLPCCRQFKKMDENCRCEAIKHIVNAAVAAAAAAPSEGEGDGQLADSVEAWPRETAK